MAASSPSALFHSATCWDLNGMIHSERDRQTDRERETVTHTDRDRSRNSLTPPGDLALTIVECGIGQFSFAGRVS